MGVTPLSLAQRTAADSLVTAGRLSRVPPDLARAAAFMRQADDTLEDLPRLTKAQNRYNLAYDACHDVGEAIMAAYGYRTTNGAGQHEALGRFVRIVLDSPPGDRASGHYDRLRRARNQQRYRAAPIGSAEADLAVQTAQDLFDGAEARGITA
ncbi:hypothetical protein [Demequina sp.]|uniref:hypothetical protein n=1 Tax=Demequina sp. TaxID=2050685 RepID=UPI0025C3E8FA|nr:hypothetical protein [Demequina sp.]